MLFAERLETDPLTFQDDGLRLNHAWKAIVEVELSVEPVRLYSASPLMTVPFLLDRASATPLHRQIYDRWRSGILGGRFRRGERIPSTRSFADTFGVSRVTVTAAYDQLLADGYFETPIRSGTFVSQELPDEPLRPIRVARPAARPGRRLRLPAYASRLDPIHQMQP